MLRSRGPLKTKLGRQKRMRHDSAGSRPRKRDVAWTGVRRHSSTSLRANDYRGFPVFFFHSLHFSARSCRFAIGCSDECSYFLHSLLISLKHSPPVVFLFVFFVSSHGALNVPDHAIRRNEEAITIVTSMFEARRPGDIFCPRCHSDHTPGPRSTEV
jgi:hypothetical protein